MYSRFNSQVPPAKPIKPTRLLVNGDEISRFNLTRENTNYRSLENGIPKSLPQQQNPLKPKRALPSIPPKNDNKPLINKPTEEIKSPQVQMMRIPHLPLENNYVSRIKPPTSSGSVVQDLVRYPHHNRTDVRYQVPENILNPTQRYPDRIFYQQTDLNRQSSGREGNLLEEDRNDNYPMVLKNNYRSGEEIEEPEEGLAIIKDRRKVNLDESQSDSEGEEYIYWDSDSEFESGCAEINSELAQKYLKHLEEKKKRDNYRLSQGNEVGIYKTRSQVPQKPLKPKRLQQQQQLGDYQSIIIDNSITNPSLNVPRPVLPINKPFTNSIPEQLNQNKPILPPRKNYNTHTSVGKRAIEDIPSNEQLAIVLRNNPYNRPLPSLPSVNSVPIDISNYFQEVKPFDKNKRLMIMDGQIPKVVPSEVRRDQRYTNLNPLGYGNKKEKTIDEKAKETLLDNKKAVISSATEVLKDYKNISSKNTLDLFTMIDETTMLENKPQVFNETVKLIEKNNPHVLYMPEMEETLKSLDEYYGIKCVFEAEIIPKKFPNMSKERQLKRTFELCNDENKHKIYRLPNNNYLEYDKDLGVWVKYVKGLKDNKLTYAYLTENGWERLNK